MVALTAEINNQILEEMIEHSPVFVVPEIIGDRLVRARAARFIGACVTGQEFEQSIIETNLQVQPIESLYDAIHLAAEGDPVARKMVETNVRTDVIERTIKAGHVIKVDLQVDEAGKIQQHGQSMESVQANSLRLASGLWQMRERIEAEATNAFRIQDYYNQGVLEDYSFVVFSRAADNMTEKQMDRVGFFTDTMSCAIQVTTAKDGRLTTESAFVAGTRQPGEIRHDADTLNSVGHELNIDFSGKTAAETIATPILIPNELIPNGAIDLVRLWDLASGTFFGEDKPPQDYLEYLGKCQEREQMLQPKVDAILQELIGEAPTITSPLLAVKRLHKLSEKHMVEQAAFDDSIDPRVFGAEAAVHIEQARIQFEHGNNQAGLDELSRAKETAKSSSCPTVLNSSTGLDGLDGDKKPDNSNQDCEFISKECPKCHKKNVKTKITKNRITGSCGCSVKK